MKKKSAGASKNAQVKPPQAKTLATTPAGRTSTLLAGLLTIAFCSSARVVAAPPPPDDHDSLQLGLSESLSYDNNLFRLPAGVAPATGDGNTERSSLVRTDTLGLAWDKPYSLQRLHADISAEHHHYSNHDFLDFNAVNGSLAWNWALTPHLTGLILADRKQTLNSFTDYRNQSVRNVRTNQSRVASADYEALGSWHLIAAATRFSSVGDDNTQPLEDAYTSRGVQAGVKYIFSSGSYLSYVERREKGEYPGNALLAPTLTDSEFQQRAHELQAVWAYSKKTVFTGRLTNSERTHPHFSQRDYSGTAGRIDMNWRPTGKTSLVASAGRDYSVFQSSYSNYIVTDTISITPAWQISAKTALKAQIARSSRDFLGDPFGPVAKRKDNITSSQLELDWDATRTIGVGAVLRHDSRDSSYPGFGFSDNTATLNFRLVF